MNSLKQHQFHLVDLSPWPILTSCSMLCLAIGSVMLMHCYNLGGYVTAIGCSSLLFCLYSWWRKVIKEGIEEQQHTEPVRQGLRIGMALFILSEIMFFLVFFSSILKAKLFPIDILEDIWISKIANLPPMNIQELDPWEVPFLNTLILLLSGTTVTWAHYAIEENNQRDSITALALTILLGLMFTGFQAYEYYHANFKLTDGIYGANFYLATGFHGIHVIIGTIFLIICYFRACNGDFKKGNGHLGFEFAAWYWHFIDVIWLFLFVFLYL